MPPWLHQIACSDGGTDNAEAHELCSAVSSTCTLTSLFLLRLDHNGSSMDLGSLRTD